MINSHTKQIIWILAIGFLTGCESNSDLKWNQQEGYRWASVSTSYWGETGFEKLESSSTNIQFSNRVTEESITENRNYLNGSGVAASDVDGDGLVDLYFAQLDGPNKLYKNLGGLQFRDITEEAGVPHNNYNSTGVVFADVDGDKDPDLLVTSLTDRNELYINDGKGNFQLKKESGLGPSRGSNTMALADIDGDGDLDLYITNYKFKTARDIYTEQELTTQNTLKKQGDSVVVIPPYDQYYGIIEAEHRSYRNEYGERDELYLNDGNGNFEKVTDTKTRFLDREGNPKGLSRDWGLTARFQDVNADGLPDLFVANDFWTPDRFWINQGEGVFRQAGRHILRSMSLSSMGVDFSDINRDGSLDFFVTEMLSSEHQRRMRQLSEQMDLVDDVPQFNRNSMYLNRGDNTFAEISYFSNLEATEWSWATNFLDVDLDGYEDLIITTGHAYDYQDMDTQLQMNQRGQAMQGGADLMQFPRLELPNKIFRNNGDLTFSDQSSAWGFNEKDISLGLAYADLDNDGDPDLVMNRLDQEATVFENKSSQPRIAVQLEGNTPNTHGIGAKIELEGAGPVQQKEVVAGGSYVSGSQPMVFFAADEENPNHQIMVTWPNGKRSIVDSVKANRIYIIEESSANRVLDEAQPDSVATPGVPLFQDVSDRISHMHTEDPYTDTNVQSLLPVKVSEQGPGISWIDIDGDRDDDLLISGGKGSRLSIYENRGNGRFRQVQNDELTYQTAGDQTTILGWNHDGATSLLIGSANFEQGDPGAPSAYHYKLYKNGTVEEQSLPGTLSTTGPLAAADYDSDGDLDLFIGGSFNPAKYPRDADSRIFRNENGTYQLDRANSRKMSGLGLVSGAVFTDYDQDGDPDLLISRKWDSIILYQNNEGNFQDVSSSAGLQDYKGWWNGIATGDFNNDGRPDIIATNIGQNSTYQLDTDRPLKLYYSDFNMDGKVDIVDAYYEPGLEGYVPRRRLYSFDALPSVLRSVSSHTQFASSTVDDIFRQNFEKIPSKEINTLQHMVFINTGSGFEARPLPEYTQFSAAYHAGVADFDNDGNDDLFLSQNLFDLARNIPRVDAGRGVLLKGDGSANLNVIRGQDSGIKVYGEQRGAAIADFNRDGKADLAVTQNQDSTKLFLNQTENRGIRVHLEGTSSNRDAIGSAIRLTYKDGSKGPLREIQAGSGYWSQQSTTQVLGISAGKVPDSVQIQWFNGSQHSVPVKEGQYEITVAIE